MPETNSSRKLAGAALALFFLSVIGLTWGNKILQERSIPTVDAVTVMHGELAMDNSTKYFDALVPQDALNEDLKGTYIFLVVRSEDSLGARMEAQKTYVEVLGQTDTTVAVEGDIRQGSAVVVQSNKPISDGSRIRLSEGSL